MDYKRQPYYMDRERFQNLYWLWQWARPQLSLSANKRFAGCCLPDQSLVGDPDSAFDCCAGGHDLAGSKETGYRCCPTGWTYDGEICEEQNDVTCSNGKALVDGKCVCPTGSSESSDGVCEPQKCVSGLETGKQWVDMPSRREVANFIVLNYQANVTISSERMVSLWDTTAPTT